MTMCSVVVLRESNEEREGCLFGRRIGELQGLDEEGDDGGELALDGTPDSGSRGV